MTKEKVMLLSNLEACQQRVEKLKNSLQRNAALFPLTPAALASLGVEQEESIDALILRYSQCVSMMQEQLFRGIAYLEQEDISDKSNQVLAPLPRRKRRSIGTLEPGYGRSQFCCDLL